MYLTNHKELGDVTGGREVTLENYFEIFDGLLTPEQMEGLKELPPCGPCRRLPKDVNLRDLSSDSRQNG